MISRAKDNLTGVDNVSADIGSLRETGQASASYSKILAYSVLQYLPSEEQVAEALHEIARVLQPGGRALLAANPDPAKLPAHREWINGWKDTAARDREIDLLEKTIWVLPQTLIDLAAQAGLEATAEPINTRILQHFYMFDLVVQKHG
jgi:SAM-dependent methyltransferase